MKRFQRRAAVCFVFRFDRALFLFHIYFEPRINRNGAGFEPYANNGGTVVAVAGSDYCIIAADSRLSDGYAILSRNVSRVHRLSGDTHLATAGCWADTQGLLRLLRVRGPVCLFLSRVLLCYSCTCF